MRSVLRPTPLHDTACSVLNPSLTNDPTRSVLSPLSTNASTRSVLKDDMPHSVLKDKPSEITKLLEMGEQLATINALKDEVITDTENDVYDAVIRRLTSHKKYDSLIQITRSADKQIKTALENGSLLPHRRQIRPQNSESFSSQVRNVIINTQNELDDQDTLPKRGRFKISDALQQQIRNKEAMLGDTQTLRFGSRLEKIRNYHILKRMEEKLHSGGFEQINRTNKDKLDWAQLPFSQKVMQILQSQDEECIQIITELQADQPSKTWENHEDALHKEGMQPMGYFLKDGILMVTPPQHKQWRRDQLQRADEARIYVPRAIRSHLLHAYHRSPIFCHPGTDKMFHTLNRIYYYPNMHADVAKTIAGCLACARVKTPYRYSRDIMYGFLPSEPFSHVQVDLAGPLPADEQGNTHVLCITCAMSRWTALVAIGGDSDGHVDAIAIANKMIENWIKLYGVPQIVLIVTKEMFLNRKSTESTFSNWESRTHF